MNGPSRCAPITHGPPLVRPAGSSCNAATSSSSGAVMNVGW